MARKKFEEEADNHERWLVSYADLVTLLFAFFVVMYAISSVNEGKYRELSNAIGTAFGGVKVLQAPNPLPELPTQGLPRPLIPKKERDAEAILKREKEQMTSMARDLLNAMAPLVSQGKVKLTQTSRGISIEINSSVLFAQGDARLSPESLEALAAVAQVLANDHHVIQVEGHTDDLPINTPLFPSNWELSAVRAGSVIRLFIEQGIAAGRVTAVGRGATRPVASNATPEGRQSNRRVEVIIQSAVPESARELAVER